MVLEPDTLVLTGGNIRSPTLYVGHFRMSDIKLNLQLPHA
jgi:hypothetical protein